MLPTKMFLGNRTVYQTISGKRIEICNRRRHMNTDCGIEETENSLGK